MFFFFLSCRSCFGSKSVGNDNNSYFDKNLGIFFFLNPLYEPHSDSALVSLLLKGWICFSVFVWSITHKFQLAASSTAGAPHHYILFSIHVQIPHFIPTCSESKATRFNAPRAKTTILFPTAVKCGFYLKIADNINHREFIPWPPAPQRADP